MKPFITFENIVCHRNGKKTVGIDHLSLDKGDRLGIIGPNGAGKSTLLKACALLEPPNEGSVTYQGKPLSVASPALHIRREWACVFQHSQRFQSSVFHNVEIGLKIRKLPKEERHKKVMKWLETFRIDHLANEHAFSLSGGEAQRMNLARAFVLEPSVLFLDEPFSALDFPTKMSLIEELNGVLKETKTTVLFITHDLTEVKLLTNRLLYLESGAAYDNGATDEVLNDPSNKLATFLKPWQIKESFQHVDIHAK
ncbi:energy-coupling factor ABC transporter ATP-binding protein [Bacillus shivajii]|uniref:energy-coupling factor ABC transporter ATP-binding protein n=1 Tax=Bacillus shivajii TaxID=1983719 RepID=UPI001CF94A83|nr:ABC transporter ATP-binding protein [Bacillus shivajii]UCZ53498.1 energy-coupling factor ABC transporter ATP-binding protein [Bacillus shivajii]